MHTATYVPGETDPAVDIERHNARRLAIAGARSIALVARRRSRCRSRIGVRVKSARVAAKHVPRRPHPSLRRVCTRIADASPLRAPRTPADLLALSTVDFRPAGPGSRLARPRRYIAIEVFPDSPGYIHQER
jgi:hypothetical protein